MRILKDAQFCKDYGPGYVFFSFTTNSIISDGIALFTAGERTSGIKVAHCGVIDHDGQCIEAVADDKKKVVRSNFRKEYLENENRVVFLKKPAGLNDANAEIFIELCEQHIGKNYAYSGIFGSFVFTCLSFGYRLAPWLRRLKNPFNADSELFCSELVSEGMRDSRVIGEHGVLVWHPTNIYPQTLFEDISIWVPWKAGIIQEKEAAGRHLEHADLSCVLRRSYDSQS